MPLGSRGEPVTSAYEVDVTPDEIEIRCPRCDGPAVFRFAVAAYVDSKVERAEVADHSAYDLETTVQWANNRRSVAVYYPDLDLSKTLSFEGAGLARYYFREFADRGMCLCRSCGHRDRHRLRWPEEAVYSCQVRGKTLWAWTREHTVVLRDYIASTVRDRPKFRHRFFLMRVPSHFLSAKHRDEATRKLDRLLE